MSMSLTVDQINDEFIDYSVLLDGTAVNVPVELIDDFPTGNIRRDRDPASFDDLCKSVAQTGVTQAITVRPNPSNPTRLEALAGYGRLEASKVVKLDEIPVVVKQVDDKVALQIMLDENLKRQDLSIADEIIAAQRYVSYFDGDYDSAAKQLGWSIARLKGRLLLNKCTEKVLDALHKGIIKLGHAEILSQFVDSLQDGTLDKIVKENWTVAYLRERAGKAQRHLKQAKFDTSGCESCPHNSEMQANLFDTSVGKSKCGDLQCFKEKTEAWVADYRKELEVEHGVVLLAIDKPSAERNRISVENVGAKQFVEGCAGCEKNVVVLQDGINNNCGELSKDQCIDTGCFRKMHKALVDKKESEKAAVAQKTAVNAEVVTTGNATTPKTAVIEKTAVTAKTPVEQKTPKVVIEGNLKLLREASYELCLDDLHLCEAVHVASFEKKLSGAGSRDFKKTVHELYALSESELLERKKKNYLSYLSTHNPELTESNDVLDTLISFIPLYSHAKATVVAKWMPTEEMLKRYTKTGLTSITTLSGFTESYELLHGKGTFHKVKQSSKAALISAIFKHPFDWSAFAPKDLFALVRNKSIKAADRTQVTANETSEKESS